MKISLDNRLAISSSLVEKSEMSKAISMYTMPLEGSSVIITFPFSRLGIVGRSEGMSPSVRRGSVRREALSSSPSSNSM